ncbi:hypothetical protein C4D60_Mb08t16190 [Musa balbisiana]|uniref:Uncharacterized protein n=1 Tax=Musa balbisiana TaxID=52838 RepID=A0A4S8K4B4_MUSBA|nr:hypothetical protein C4D60_Mb08t16190 [Musa balbisiana]
MERGRRIGEILPYCWAPPQTGALAGGSAHGAAPATADRVGGCPCDQRCRRWSPLRAASPWASAVAGTVRAGSARGCHRLRTASGSSYGRPAVYSYNYAQQQLLRACSLFVGAAYPCGRYGRRQHL